MDEGFVLVLSLFLKYVRSAIRPLLHYSKSFWIHREFLLLVSNIVFRPKEDWSQNHHLAHNLVRHSLHSIHEPFVVISENMNHTYFFSNVADSFRTQFQWYWEISWIGLREYQRRSQRPIELATTDNYTVGRKKRRGLHIGFREVLVNIRYLAEGNIFVTSN